MWDLILPQHNLESHVLMCFQTRISSQAISEQSGKGYTAEAFEYCHSFV